ncbi:MAG TPA: hypothetical protein VLU47_06350, partial [Blastocatellia bacterium]|nr:hypothetical protein [Blastocatellia bacterium]
MSTTRKNYQEESITWEETRDPEYPYCAKVNQDNYLIRLNDFPDESLYTLVVNNEEIEDLEDWPERWIISSESQDQRAEQHKKVRKEIVARHQEEFAELLHEEKVKVIHYVISELKSKRDRDLLFRYYIGEEDEEKICS